MAKIIAFAGSTRIGSFNKKLVQLAAESARKEGGEVNVIDLRDFPMPIYDGDFEESDGIPANAEKLYEMMMRHQGLLLACPEYNSSISAVLKNTIDWVSRPRKGEPPLAAFSGKVAALMSASPGALGGLRGLVHVRSILGNIGVLVIPNQIAIPNASAALNLDGGSLDPALTNKIANLARDLVETTRKIHDS